jgi:CDP-diacylglycerol--serine O-phosphatidyltransferase
MVLKSANHGSHFNHGNKKTKRAHRWSAEDAPWKSSPLSRLLPNGVTLAALCMGLTAIRFAFLTQWQAATASVLIAGFLDGLDGRLARYLRSSSEFGAELDSLADFINFGAAPALIVYFFSLHHLGNIGWGCSLFFAACMALRLARFNIMRLHPSDSEPSSLFSVGMPAPAGALVTLSPMVALFVFESVPTWIFASMILFSASMMVSRYPTFLINKIIIPSCYRNYVILGALAFITSLITAPWETLLFVVILYVGTLPLSGVMYRKRSQPSSKKF